MTILAIPLSEQEQRLLEERAAQSGFQNSVDYVKRLIEEVIDIEDVEQKLAEGVSSGPSAPMDDQDWNEIEREVLRRVAQRRGE